MVKIIDKTIIFCKYFENYFIDRYIPYITILYIIGKVMNSPPTSCYYIIDHLLTKERKLSQDSLSFPTTKLISGLPEQNAKYSFNTSYIS